MNLYDIGLPDSKQFNFKDCVIAEDECVLITPKDMGVEWNDQNKYFRSSIWRKSCGKLISAGYRKFVNYGEKPEFEPFPQNTMLCAVEKKDGSSLIVSDHKDKLIVRTRGTVDASTLANGHEIELLKKKYPKAFDNEWLKAGWYSLLFEWTTPTNRIVLKESEEPTLWLIGMIDHFEYRYIDQFNLNQYAKEMGVDRPKTHRFLMSDTLDDIKKEIEPLKDIEGVVVYDGSGQILKKIKTLRYLYLHRIFTGVKTVDHLFNVWKDSGYLVYDYFKEYLADQYDHELVLSLNELINELFVIRDNILVITNRIHEFVNHKEFKDLPRKEQAQQIITTWGKWSGLAFNILDKNTFCLEKAWKLMKADHTI